MKEKVKDIQGNETSKTIAETLAEILGTQSKGNVVKIYGWYQKLQAGEPLNLDEADKEVLKNILEQDERIFIYIKGQILKAIK